MKRVLITGAGGYIGSHLVHELASRGGFEIFAIDRNHHVPNNIAHLVKGIRYANILDSGLGAELLSQEYDAVVHLAADISVEESMSDPVKYWTNNLLTTSRIIDTLKGAHLIFASTGTAEFPTNPYAQSKLACEHEIRRRILQGYTIFRFYNVCGLRDGLKTTSKITHLMPIVAKVARGDYPQLTVYGTEYDTPDGTCIRDYVHVMDLANAIVAAIIHGPSDSPHEGIGSGTGYSVLDVAAAMGQVSGKKIQLHYADPRPGDVAKMVCSNQYKHLNIEHDLLSMCESVYKNI